MLIREDITFTGRVQGVFFRATAERIARGFAVTGWVRNEADGSVRCVVEGEADEVDRFVEAVREAKAGNIDEVRRDRKTATGEHVGFTIRR